MAFRAVIFDIGGVLSHHNNLAPLDPWIDRLNMSVEQILYTVFGNEVGRRASLGQATVEDVWERANQTFRLPLDDRQALISDFWATMTWDTQLLNFIGTLKSRSIQKLI